MQTEEVKINGVTYKVSSTTHEGLQKAIQHLKQSLKPKKKKEE